MLQICVTNKILSKYLRTRQCRDEQKYLLGELTITNSKIIMKSRR